MYNYPFIRPSLLSKGINLAKGITFSSFLDGTQKTLGVINQTIPLINQVSPLIKNAHAMFKIAGELKNDNSSKKNVINNTDNNSSVIKTSSNRPIFYI